MVVIDMSVGSRITNLRKRMNLTQEGFSKKIGISRAALSHYEKDRREPDYETLTKMANYFEVSTDYIIYGENKEDDFDPIAEHNRLLEKYGIEDSGFFDIEKWKEMGPEELKQLESYFQFIYEQSQKKNEDE